MKHESEMGLNRTGIQMSPLDSAEMKDANALLAHPSSGDESALQALRSLYIAEADPLGTVPMPGTLKGVVSAGMSMLSGDRPQVFLDKLGERIAFERTGTRLYDALITKVQASNQHDPGLVPVERLMQIRDEEARHFALVAEAMRSIGGDPTAQTPCADVAGVESLGLLQTIADPRTTVTQSLHAVLVAEMTDNNGWEILIALAREQGHQAMAAEFTVALEREREHLHLVQSWFEQLTLGAASILPSKAVAADAQKVAQVEATAPLH